MEMGLGAVGDAPAEGEGRRQVRRVGASEGDLKELVVAVAKLSLSAQSAVGSTRGCVSGAVTSPTRAAACMRRRAGVGLLMVCFRVQSTSLGSRGSDSSPRVCAGGPCAVYVDGPA